MVKIDTTHHLIFFQEEIVVITNLTNNTQNCFFSSPSPLTGNILDFHLAGCGQSRLDHSSAEQALHTEGMWVTLELTIISGKEVSNGCKLLMVAHSLVVAGQRD